MLAKHNTTIVNGDSAVARTLEETPPLAAAAARQDIMQIL